ncbi:FAD-dependent oxidoreductase [Frigidibacter sp. RF13]|uniref:NAD(P)/FAD-dependent oxidoreductase n=1 Tax=Frigidibacter sp. RF13 TaxID=2997340 RepID=UPI00226F3E61|nr:FAD-dependent oxidoreductase [Frigidibacter sp. RF13]MCY1127492.1 FAD-dependent oxidoreductase [Frigidibacter sp. RF13]
MSDPDETVDVAIVGGGPAGLAAATELRRHGVARVLVLEREAEAGGIPRHCGHYPFGMREFHRLLRGPDYAARLVRRAEAAGAVIRTGTTVTGLGPDGRLSVCDDRGTATVTARAVLLATGVRETSRAARLIGGEKPGGILPTGALQGLVYLNHQKPFDRPVIIGSELVAFSALLTCRHAGIRPVAIIEAGDRATARWPVPLLARFLGIPFLARTRLEAIHGTRRVEGIDLAGATGERSLQADGVIVTGQFRPEASLLREGGLRIDPATGGPEVDGWGRLSDPAYFAAGNLLRGVETAGWSWAEGRRAASAIAAHLRGDLPEGDRSAPIALDHAALKFAMPQILPMAPAEGRGLAPFLQIRLATPARGRLCLWQGDRIIAYRRLNHRPEQRILMPLPTIDPNAPPPRLTIEPS